MNRSLFCLGGDEGGRLELSRMGVAWHSPRVLSRSQIIPPCSVLVKVDCKHSATLESNLETSVGGFMVPGENALCFSLPAPVRVEVEDMGGSGCNSSWNDDYFSSLMGFGCHADVQMMEPHHADVRPSVGKVGRHRDPW